MKLYVLAAALTAILYPVLASFVWGFDTAHRAFAWSGGVFTFVATGIVASYVRVKVQKLSMYVPYPLTAGILHLISAEVVGICSLILLMVAYRYGWGVEVALFSTFDTFLLYHFPAFLASYISFYAAGWLLESDSKRGRRG